MKHLRCLPLLAMVWGAGCGVKGPPHPPKSTSSSASAVPPQPLPDGGCC